MHPIKLLMLFLQMKEVPHKKSGSAKHKKSEEEEMKDQP
jgi:hypothetical protein